MQAKIQALIDLCKPQGVKSVSVKSDDLHIQLEFFESVGYDYHKSEPTTPPEDTGAKKDVADMLEDEEFKALAYQSSGG